MLMTSISSYGFLTKSHLEQGAATIDNGDKIARLDQQISREKSTIADDEKVVSQLDAAVNSYIEKDNTDRAVYIRKQQASQRKQLRDDIDQAQKRIDQYAEQKLQLGSEIKKYQLEVGPIKYIAELFYGTDNTEQTTEAAVRYFTLLIVICLDPLAVILLIAANHTMMRLDEEKERKSKERSNSAEGNSSADSTTTIEENVAGTQKEKLVRSSEMATVAYKIPTINEEVDKNTKQEEQGHKQILLDTHSEKSEQVVGRGARGEIRATLDETISDQDNVQNEEEDEEEIDAKEENNSGIFNETDAPSGEEHIKIPSEIVVSEKLQESTSVTAEKETISEKVQINEKETKVNNEISEGCAASTTAHQEDLVSDDSQMVEIESEAITDLAPAVSGVILLPIIKSPKYTIIEKEEKKEDIYVSNQEKIESRQILPEKIIPIPAASSKKQINMTFTPQSRFASRIPAINNHEITSIPKAEELKTNKYVKAHSWLNEFKR